MKKKIKSPDELEQFRSEIQAGRGTLYDPRCVDALGKVSLLRFLEIHMGGQPDFLIPPDHREVLGAVTIDEFVRDFDRDEKDQGRVLFEHYYRIAIQGGPINV